jgi:hypothetical protein
MRPSYGEPPWFVPRVFVRVFAAVAGLAAVVAGLAAGLGEPIGLVDMTGIIVTAPLLSYLVHLWLLPWPGCEHENTGA